jgi:hypothetical protein
MTLHMPALCDYPDCDSAGEFRYGLCFVHYVQAYVPTLKVIAE